MKSHFFHEQELIHREVRREEAVFELLKTMFRRFR